MSLHKWTTLQPAQIRRLASELARREMPVIVPLEPIADFEELLTFAEARPTPIAFAPQEPAWRPESVAARVQEAIAIAAHEPLSDDNWGPLARILLEHAEYLYTYPDAATAREKLAAGTALALASCVCHSMPQADLWRLAGFGRIANSLAEAAQAAADTHLIAPLDLAFSFAYELNLQILEPALSVYNVVRESRPFMPKNPLTFPLTTRDFFRQLNLDFPGMEQVKSAVLAGNLVDAKAAYTEFRQQFLSAFQGWRGTGPRPTGEEVIDVDMMLERSDTASTATSYLASLLQLSIHPAPAISGTTEIGIAALLFPEFRGSEQLLALALRRYQWITDAFFYPDGFHRDRTLRAQVDAIADFARFLRCQREHQTTELRPFLEKLIEACLALSHPDLSFPELGAGPAPNFRADELCEIGDIGIRRQTTSHALPDTGYYVMRNGGGLDEQYLLFDAAQLEIRSLFARGRQLCSEAAEMTKFRRNGPHPTGSETSSPQREAADTRWITSPTFDFVESWHKGRDVHHKRSIFYVKGDYFIVHDLFIGDGEHAVEPAFRLAAQQHTHLFISTVGDTDKLPAVMNTLLFPMRPEVGEHPTISSIVVDTAADVLATGFTVEANGVTDTFLISDDGFAEMSTADIEFVGEYLFLRGEQFVMLNARFLKVADNILADFGEPRESYIRMNRATDGH